jgi:purine-binding chemotaxis protein CheW
MQSLDEAGRSSHSSGRAAASIARDRPVGTQSWLLCGIGPHRFVLPMAEVIETMRLLPMQAVAGAPPLVLGLSVIRGAPVAVVNTALLFGCESPRYTRLVTVRAGQSTIALAVESVFTVAVVEADALQQMPPLIGSDNAVVAMAARDQNLVFLLNTARIVPDEFTASGDRKGIAS